jgi:tetratricopeptide (TPR) repeat protein
MAAGYKKIGVVLRNMGRLEEALDYHNKALQIDGEINNVVELALDYRNIGNVLAEMGRYQEALDYHNKALETHKQLNDVVKMAGDYYNISFVFSKQSSNPPIPRQSCPFIRAQTYNFGSNSNIGSKNHNLLLTL